MVIQQRRYTVTEFEALLHQADDQCLELMNGEIIETVPTQLHAAIVALINGFIFVFLRQNPIGWVLVEARYHIPGDEDNALIPDLSFVSKSKGKLTQTGAAPYMPDLAVEVQSPGQSDKLMADKAAYYLANGSRMVWLVYPNRRLVEVLTASQRFLLTENDTINGGDVLPGFSLVVKEIFPFETPEDDQI